MSTAQHTPETGERSSGVQRVMSDIIDLCELQWQLLSIDSQEAKQRAVRAAILMGIGVIVASIALMIVAIGVGWLLHEQADLTPGQSFLVLGAVGLLIAGLATFAGVRLLSKANESLAETKREFGENIKWLKAVLLKPKTSPRNQLRHADFPPEHIADEESRFQRFH